MMTFNWFVPITVKVMTAVPPPLCTDFVIHVCLLYYVPLMMYHLSLCNSYAPPQKSISNVYFISIIVTTKV